MKGIVVSEAEVVPSRYHTRQTYSAENVSRYTTPGFSTSIVVQGAELT